jgi:putative tryptophan/tyrosine transport system substrate-binding protein
LVSAGAPAVAQPAAAAIGLLWLGSAASVGSRVEALRQGLKDNGLVEGSDVRLIIRYADNQPERLVDLARELVNEGCGVIVVSGTTSVSAAQKAAPDTPIVMAGSADPVAMGFARSLARPGGRITGISIYGAEFIGKQLQILKEALPSARGFAAFLQATNPGNPVFRRALDDAARDLGLRIANRDIEGVDRFAAAFAWAKQQAVDGVFVIADPIFNAHDREIFRLALEHRLPAMAGNSRWVHAGALLSYTPDIDAIARRSAYYVKEILHGADPATLPIEQPAILSLAVNMATARALGIRLPNALLSRVTEVVE